MPTDKPRKTTIQANPSDQWQFLLRLNRVITANTSFEQLLEDFFSLLHTVPEIESSWFGAADSAGQIRTTLARGSFLERYTVVDTIADVIHGPSMTGPAARAWRTGEPQYCEDWLTDPNVSMFQDKTGELEWRSSAAIPLLGRSGPYAIFAIYSNKMGFFPNGWTIDMLRQIGATLGNALENRQKHAALQRAETLFRTMYQTADLLLKESTEAQILRKLCKVLVGNELFSSVMIGQVGNDHMYRYCNVAARRYARKIRDHSDHYVKGGANRPITLDCWESRKTIIANDYISIAENRGTAAIASKLNIKAVACLPIFRAGTRWAVMTVMCDERGFFDQTVIGLLEQLIAQVGHRLDELDLKATLQAERELQSRLARQDPLTKLPNRLALNEYMTSSLARAIRHKNIAGIGLIDIDRFKQFSESWGLPAGDIILKETANRLRKLLREVDFVARIGPDDFAVVLEDWNWTHDIEGLCIRLQDVLRAPIQLPNGGSVQIDISAGFTLFPMDNAPPDELLRHAEMALYAARAGRGKFEKFWRLYIDIADGTKDQFTGRSLLSLGALKVHYQPVMNLHSGKIVSVEALARLDDGSRLIMPGKFLRDLLLDDRVMLFRQVLETSLAQLKVWDQEGIHLNISVNVDAQILLLERTLPYLSTLLRETGIEPRRLSLEILETYDFIDLQRATLQLEAIRAEGIRIALDDLGAGYSSILKIRELPLDIVKLDRKFISSLTEQPDDLMFISMFQTLTKSLGMDLVVEGVETEDVMDALRMLGAHQAQGYFITKPMSAEQLSVWLRAFQPIIHYSEPKALLGAYAVHLNWLRALQFAHTQEALLVHLRTHDPFPLRQFLAEKRYLDKPLGQAYLSLQALLKDDEASRETIIKASDRFRAELITALTS